MKRMVFMGSDPIALPVLEALVSCPVAPEIAAVYTQPDRAQGRGQKVRANPIKTWAMDRAIEVRQPDRLGPEERESFEASRPDLVLVMAYGHILSQGWLDTPRVGIYNLHTSLLPAYRGASPIQATIADGADHGGVSLMRLVARMDAGPLIDREKVSIDRFETAASLETKLAAACVPLVLRHIEAMSRGDVRVDPQDESMVSYTRKLQKADGVLDFAAPARALARRINGLFPWPGVGLEMDGVPVRCGLADFRAGTPSSDPGTVLEADENALLIATGNGVLGLRRLQRPGGRMLEAADFLRGFPVRPGSVLPSRTMPVLVADRPLRG